ncbi:MAG: enoyl-CoA hydratase [Deltaproteobacteria bacterium]|nr:enoyl-CoA hydratase [Deltaproteobacteria bacterium]
MAGDIVVAIDKGVLILTMNRVSKKNALDRDMYGAIADAFDQLGRDESLRCMLIQANGNTFCAGNDIPFFLNNYSMAPDEPLGRFLNGLVGLTKPLVAAIQGATIGVGFTLLPHCDLVYATDDIRLSTPFGRFGLVPELGSSQLLTAIIGHRRAMEVFLLGKVVDAKEALALGLVNAIVPMDELHETALSAAKKLAALSAECVYETKRLTRKAPEALSTHLEDECRTFMRRVKSEETLDLFRRFLNR